MDKENCMLKPSFLIIKSDLLILIVDNLPIRTINEQLFSSLMFEVQFCFRVLTFKINFLTFKKKTLISYYKLKNL